MKKIKIGFRIFVFIVFGLLAHYVLPQHDVVRITGLSDRIVTLSSFQRYFYAQTDAGESEGAIRDIRLINTERKRTYLLGLIRSGESLMVYRNEDTGWIWPPYFKFDSSNLEAESQALSANPEQWVAITHYGWRIPFLTLYPNAISVKEVSGPDYRPVPWFNIAFFVFLILGVVFVRKLWAQFRERTVGPLMDNAGHRVDEVQAGVAARKGRISRWLDTWRSKK
jgi:hypothetical protein